MDFFRAYKVDLAVPTYFIESTAPDNVDDSREQTTEQDLTAIKDPQFQAMLADNKLNAVRPDDAIEEIAKTLAGGVKPNLVVMVHGFNNPETDVLVAYARAATTIHSDQEIKKANGLVCVGYRWPSEKMFVPLWSGWSALPSLPVWVLAAGAAILVSSVLLFILLPVVAVIQPNPTALALIYHSLHYLLSLSAHAIFMAGWILIGLILMLVLLRAIVYFRDTYRATNYGVPDLVQIIRAIDGQLGKHPIRAGKVELSFIGHSMGGLVVTNALRTLSDVFAVPIDSLNHFGAAGPKPSEDIQRIGRTFVLKRFVLASPDIPAEALLSDRGNFLASVLSRFEEAYLFSNEGDEVLRLISTLANYFSFPTKSADHGFRLGNTEILSEGYGLIPSHSDDFLAKLRVGNLSLQQLYNRLALADAGRRGMRNPLRRETQLPKVFTYFDCTDYVEPDGKGERQGLLTFALCNKRTDPNASLSFREHLQILRAYVKPAKHARKVNCHGGYFEGQLSQQLIYRLACLGYDETKDSLFEGETRLGDACREKQIRVLLSPALHKAGKGPAMAKLHS